MDIIKSNSFLSMTQAWEIVTNPAHCRKATLGEEEANIKKKKVDEKDN